MSSTTQSEASTGTTTTPSIADALRQAAEWLDAHPEVTPDHAFVRMAARTREDLEMLAAALGDAAEERIGYGDRVEIAGRFGEDEDGFGGVRVYGDLPIKMLAGKPVVPEYDPILSKRDADLDAATGEGRR